MKFNQPGDDSFESYIAEKEGILSSLAKRAKVSHSIENHDYPILDFSVLNVFELPRCRLLKRL